MINKITLEEQIYIISDLIKGVEELSEYQEGWDEELKAGYKLLEQLQDKHYK
jgi:hypothetical protein